MKLNLKMDLSSILKLCCFISCDYVISYNVDYVKLLRFFSCFTIDYFCLVLITIYHPSVFIFLLSNFKDNIILNLFKKPNNN